MASVDRAALPPWPPAGPPGTTLWAVLDCARDPAIYRALLESRLDVQCLYSGRLPRELEMAAPHLVEVLPGHRLTQRLFGEGWSRAWGVLVRTEDASNLRHHLRRLLRVSDEDGRRLLFRFYDPRVLRAYLPTCTPAELAYVFGPVAQWLAESADGTALEQFELSPGGLRRARVPRPA